MPADKNASRALISFIRAFTDLQEKHLQGIHETMRETVDGVMDGIRQISDTTEESKKKATEVLVTTYTNPDEEQRKAMDDVQGDVDRLLESMEAGEAPAAAGAPVGEAIADKLRRNAGFFSKHMEALGTMDEKLQGLLLAMMGQLSRDDVISQRIAHVMMALQALQTSLTYVLTDFETRCKDGEVDKFIGDLKSYALRTYTMEEEKKLYFSIFPEDKLKGRKAG